MNDEPWRLRAACRDRGPSLWFRGDDMTTAVAKRVCARCPVRADCLAYALDHGVVGVWAGTTAAERDRLRQQVAV